MTVDDAWRAVVILFQRGWRITEGPSELFDLDTFPSRELWKSAICSNCQGKGTEPGESLNGMTPTQTLAKLLEESGAQIVLPNATVRQAFAALEAEVSRLTAERDAVLAAASDAGLYDGDSVESAVSCIEAALNEFHKLRWLTVTLFHLQSAGYEDITAGLKELAKQMLALKLERDAAQADRERLDELEAQLSWGTSFVTRWQMGSNSLRQEIDAARKAEA